MSRAARRREARGQGSGRRGASKGKAPLWIMGGSIAAGLLGVMLVAQLNGGGLHPTPRATEHQSHVLSAERYQGYEQVEQTYVWAASIPGVLDGMYCYCHCAEHSGHYSLLDCFASDHGAGCDVCLNEAQVAYRMVQQGASLEDIRNEVDRIYGT